MDPQLIEMGRELARALVLAGGLSLAFVFFWTGITLIRHGYEGFGIKRKHHD